MIRCTTPVSLKRITYQTERFGTTELRRVIVQNRNTYERFKGLNVNFRSLKTIHVHLLVCYISEHVVIVVLH